MQTYKYPYFEYHPYQADEDAIVTALNSGWISGGRFVDSFEERLSQICGRPTLSTSNGTSAIELAYLTLKIVPDNKYNIILPGFGFFALQSVANNYGLRQIFCDVDKDTWNLDPNKLEDLINPNTVAVGVIHNYGNLCDIDAIKSICKSNGLFLIEDCAESFGSHYADGRPVGSVGDASTFSFHVTKTISTGEGGAINFAEKFFYDRASSIKNHGLESRGSYERATYGMNFRLSNLLAALGDARLYKLSWILEEKKKIYNYYREKLDGVPGISFQKLVGNPEMWVFAFNSGKPASRIVTRLKDRGIEARTGFPSFIPWSESTKLSLSVVSLPSFVGLRTHDLDYIINETIKILGD